VKEKEPILIGIPTGDGRITAALGKMLFDAAALSDDPDHPFRYGLYMPRGYRPVDKARNLIVQEALKLRARRVMMVDSDMNPPWNWWVLLCHDEPAVSGVMYGWGKPLGQEGSEILLNVAYDLAEDGSFYSVEVNRKAPFHVDAVGSANLVLRTELFEQLSPPWFKTKWSEIDGGVDEGEDMAFFRRAHDQLGIRALVDPRIRFGHEKAVDLMDVAHLTQFCRRLGYEEGARAGFAAGQEGAVIVDEENQMAGRQAGA